MRPKPFSDPKFFILLLVFLIFFFSFLSYWRFKEFQKSLSKIEFPKLEMPKTELIPLPPKIEEIEFVSPDGKLKFKYGSDWREIGGDGGLLKFSKQQVEGAKILFFAQKLSENIGFLSVQEMESAPEQTLEEIINKINGNATTSEAEIINLTINDKEAVFEVDYKKEGVSMFHSKEKIVRNENRVYQVTILAFSQGWSSIEPEASQILDSIKIVE